MEQLFQPGWWFSFFSQAAAWWFFCLVASLAALPLSLRLFRGLADKGAGLATGVGLILTTYVAWLLSLHWFTWRTESAMYRIMLLIIGCFLLGLGLFLSRRRNSDLTERVALLFPAGLTLFLSIVALPHGFFSIWFSVLLVAAGSVAAWITDLPGLKRQLKKVAVPFIITQLLFLVAFLFFTNVRSYLPYATFELSLYQAEKWGNYNHINSIMESEFLPPKDLWFNEQPTNYYYGGHLLTATIAKATFTPAHVAFNLGLATIFALTFVMGFSFTLSLVYLTTRKYHLFRGLSWHSGLTYAFLGAFAIAMFGNLDPFRQLLTRDMDAGVRLRWQRAQQEHVEEWKTLSGVPSGVALQAYASTVTASPYDAPPTLAADLGRLGEQASSPADKVKSLAASVEARFESLQSSKEHVSSRQIEDTISGMILTPQAKSLYEGLTSVNAVKFEEQLLQRLVEGKYDEVVRKLREAAEAHEDYGSQLKAMAADITANMDAALASRSLDDFQGDLNSLADKTPETSVFGVQAADARIQLQRAIETKSYQQIGNTLQRFADAPASDAPGAKKLESELDDALSDFSIDVVGYLNQQWGGQPPTFNPNPTIDEIRFAWENVSFVNFWDPSRAIKGTPPGNKEAGTITEFPYFSAILGDHHPHHFALPFTLAALCACLSLLRKNSRRKSSDMVFFRRSWPDLLAMGFFIGAVFPVNIWDAVVLAPLYAVVVLIAWRNVKPGREWRWVGFAGFIVLLSLIVGTLYNSMPGAAPLFQNFKFFLLATALLAGGIPIALRAFDSFPRWQVGGGLFLLVLLCIFTGGFTAPEGGGGAALRDVFVFLLLAGISASWTLGGGRRSIGNWWYSAGAIYAAVGIIAIVTILPFKLFFASPLETDTRIFYDLMPPILSHELTHTPGHFWTTFWSGSPVNPFPYNLRTDFRDFIVHWGIFFIPILIFAIARIFPFSREKKNGFTFMVLMLVFGIIVFARNYLQYWVGAISLGMMTLSLFYAFAYRRKAEGPMWAFLAIAFFWTWFVEALHFDDDYGGHLERYNTPFKIYYPLWPIFAGGMVVAVREVFGRMKVKLRGTRQILTSAEFWVYVAAVGIAVPLMLKAFFPAAFATVWYIAFWTMALLVIVLALMAAFSPQKNRGAENFSWEASRAVAHWPALLVGFGIFGLGMYYPIGATATRTHEFFTWPMVDSYDYRLPYRNIYMIRTLDAEAHFAEFPKYRQDYKAWVWMDENLPDEAKILERPGMDAYSHVGRMAPGSGHPTVIDWGHHENQWRGRAKAAPLALKYRYRNEIAGLTDLNKAFQPVMGGPTDLSSDAQMRLRLSSDKDRLAILRELFPKASLMQIYRLRRAVQKNDINMTQVMQRMFADANDMYRETDKEKIRRLFGAYGIEYVVVGELERQEYGQNLPARFTDWKFQIVYDSSDHFLPIDQTNITQPTLVLRVPDDFPIVEATE